MRMSAPGDRRRTAAIVAGLAALLAANLFLRHVLEDAPRYLYSFLDTFYPNEVPVIFGELPRWRLLLPLRELTGAWAATTLLTTWLVERVLSPAGAWYLFNAASILVAFGTSWVLFRSAVFSFTFAIAIGFGTHYYHAYAVTGGIASYLLISYNMLLLFTFAQLVRGAGPRPLWGAAFAGAMLLNFIGYEGWLDVLVAVWVASPLVYLGLRRMSCDAEARRLVTMTALLTAIGVVYVVMKVTLGFGQTQGSESDVVFNYDRLWPVVDDVVSNAFTHAYMSVSNFLPPSLAGASAMYRLGPDYLIDAQHGYHDQFLYLVPMHQVFHWRYFAGVAVTLLVGGLGLVALRFWREPSPWLLALGVFLVLALVAGPTHTLIKFRPMKAMPVMTYHITVGVIGMSLAIAWLTTTLFRRWQGRPRAAVWVAAVWVFILYGALERPAYLAHMSAQVGLGEGIYPNPMRALVERLGWTYDAPRGLAAYRLAPYRADAVQAQARAVLGPLPGPLPPLSEWQAPGGATVTEVTGGVRVDGDATQFGYQLMSPSVGVAPGTTYLFRVRYDVEAGRVCAGILTGDQQRWVVPPDGSAPEYLFTAGDYDAVRVVLANCHAVDVGNLPTRATVRGGSYAILTAPGVSP